MVKKILILVGVVIAFYVLLIALGQAKNPFSSTASRIGDDGAQEGDLRCDLKRADGSTITITGRGPEFEKLCRQTNPINLYGYQWYPLYYYYWWPNWGWRTIGRQPSGGHGSGTGGGTGGGGGTGTGAGTGTPGTGTP